MCEKRELRLHVNLACTDACVCMQIFNELSNVFINKSYNKIKSLEN